MNMPLKSLIIPVVAGVFVNVISAYILGRRAEQGTGTEPGKDQVGRTVKYIFQPSAIKWGGSAFLIFLIIVYVTTLIAPYEIQHVSWCQYDNSVKIEGQIINWTDDTPKPNQAVQIQIFPDAEGEKDAIEPGVIARSDNGGEFSTIVDKTSSYWAIKSNRFDINIVYEYKDMIGFKHDYKFDDKYPIPSPCK